MASREVQRRNDSRRKKSSGRRTITLAELAELASPRHSMTSSRDSLDEVDRGNFSPLDSLHTRSLEALKSSKDSDNFLFPSGIHGASPSSAIAVREALGGLSNMEDFDRVKIGAGFYGEVFKVQCRRKADAGRIHLLSAVQSIS